MSLALEGDRSADGHRDGRDEDQRGRRDVAGFTKVGM
jgi:hypothetical protein